MEASLGASYGPLLRCREDSGGPARLVGEDDVFCLPAAEELWLRLDSDGGGRIAGSRARLTSHRLFLRDAAADAWVALRLDAVASAECAGGGLFRARQVILRLVDGRSLSAGRADSAKTQELHEHVRAALDGRRWLQGSFEAASLGGLQRILGQRESRQQAVGETLDVALADLRSLKQHAAQTVAAARQVAQHGARAGGEASGADAGVQQLLEDFGLLAEDGSLVASGGEGRSDVDADVARVCTAALEKRGGFGMLLAHDVFCLVNRTRGTSLLSPEELLGALRRSHKSGQLRVRALGSTRALAVSLARTSDAEVDAQLARLADAEPLSAFTLGSRLGAALLTSAEAQYLLRDAESRAVLVRDDAPDGVFYYRNFFPEF